MSGSRRNPNPDELKKSNFDPNDPNRTVKQPDDAYLTQLPYDILRDEIGKKYLSLEDQYNLSRESCGLYTLFETPASEHVHKFLTHVVRGEKAESEAMLKEDPGLLLHKARVVDEAGRTIIGTAYQIALGAKDVSPFPGQVEEMAEMIERYLLQLPNGEEERNKQYNEQFPEGFEKEEEARKQRDLDALQKVFKAIDKAKNDHELDDAIKVFKQYLEKENKREFKTGYHFNEDLFIKALKLYDQYVDRFNWNKRDFAAVKVIGRIQCYFPANLAQAARDGFVKVVDEKKALSRSKLLKYNGTSFFDPELGVSHFVYSFYAGFAAVGSMVSGRIVSFSKLMLSKNINLFKRQNIVSKYKANINIKDANSNRGFFSGTVFVLSRVFFGKNKTNTPTGIASSSQTSVTQTNEVVVQKEKDLIDFSDFSSELNTPQQPTSSYPFLMQLLSKNEASKSLYPSLMSNDQDVSVTQQDKDIAPPTYEEAMERIKLGIDKIVPVDNPFAWFATQPSITRQPVVNQSSGLRENRNGISDDDYETRLSNQIIQLPSAPEHSPVITGKVALTN